jgi:uncharacterized protein YcgL (UPF0745 family)
VLSYSSVTEKARQPFGKGASVEKQPTEGNRLMNTSLKKVICMVLLGIVVICTITALFQSRRGKSVQQEVADTRRALREQGFKMDLTDFNFHNGSEARARETALTSFGHSVSPAAASQIGLPAARSCADHQRFPGDT